MIDMVTFANQLTASRPTGQGLKEMPQGDSVEGGLAALQSGEGGAPDDTWIFSERFTGGGCGAVPTLRARYVQNPNSGIIEILAGNGVLDRIEVASMEIVMTDTERRKR